MIGRLRGHLAEKRPGRIVLDVGGVGYEVFVTMATYGSIPDSGAEIALDILTHVREDAIQLYGFATRQEKTIFECLTAVSGIGPRLAVTILSGGSVDGLVASIQHGDLARLTRIPGVGKKTAERILLELRDKLREFSVGAADAGSRSDVVSAMENLGYNRALVEGAIKRVLDGAEDPGFDELFRRTLQLLTKGG